MILKKLTLRVGSVTYAIKVKNLLKRSGIDCAVVKVDASDAGCTHGVEIGDGALHSAASILRSAGIKYTVIGK